MSIFRGHFESRPIKSPLTHAMLFRHRGYDALWKFDVQDSVKPHKVLETPTNGSVGRHEGLKRCLRIWKHGVIPLGVQENLVDWIPTAKLEDSSLGNKLPKN